MDNQTIRNAFRELKENQKMVLICADHTYILYQKDIMSPSSGNDLQITSGYTASGDSRGISQSKTETMYIDCTYVQSAVIKDREKF